MNFSVIDMGAIYYPDRHKKYKPVKKYDELIQPMSKDRVLLRKIKNLKDRIRIIYYSLKRHVSYDHLYPDKEYAKAKLLETEQELAKLMKQ